MQKSKKFLSALLALVMVLTAFPVMAFATVDIPQMKNITLEPGETYSFKADTDNITGYDSNVVSLTSTGTTSAKLQLGTNANYDDGEKVSSGNALYRFTTSGTGYNAQNISNTDVYVNIAHGPDNNATAGYPQTTSADPVTIEQSTSSDTSNVYLKSSSGAYLMFWKNTTHQDTANRHTFDRWSGALNDNSNETLGGTIRTGAEANLFRPITSGETSSTEIPGYVKVARASDVTAGTNYLIAYKGTNGAYYVMYPSTSDTNKFSHVARVLPNETETNYNVTITALNNGTTSFKVGDTTYKVTVSSEVAVTGAVRYDPVIYTQGADFKSFGTNIAEGVATEERKTAYQVAPGYSIDSIKVIEGAVEGGTNIRAEGGILKGTVQLTNGNSSKTLNEKIKIRTFLTGPNGEKYTQDNCLYVATSPVPAHVVSSVSSYYRDEWNVNWITVAPMGLVAKGSTSAYDSTNYASGSNPKSSNQGKYANSINLYGEDKMALSSFAAIENPTNDPKTAVTFTGDKLGGWYGYTEGQVSSNGGGQAVYGHFTGTTGHYYYDKSSSYNPGIKSTKDNGNTAQIELVLNRPIISPANNWVHDDYGDTLDVNTFTINVGDDVNLKVLSEQNSTPTVPGVSPAFKLFKYTAKNNGLQTFTVDIDASATGTINGNMFIKVSHARGGSAWWALNHSTLPFQVHVVDKSTVRTAYNNALTKCADDTTGWAVLVSSDYTTSSWNNYQEQMLLAEGYLNNYDYKQTIPTNLYNYGGELEKSYLALQKHIDLTELEKQLKDKQDLYGIDFPCNSDGYNTYTSKTWDKFQTAYENGNNYANVDYPDNETRMNTAGYNPRSTDGPYNTDLTRAQENINNAATDIRDNPVEAADPTAYEDAKEIAATLDLDAYKDTVADTITGAVTDGDAAIYEQYQGKNVVKLTNSPDDQGKVDGYTRTLVENMNVANENTWVQDGVGADNKGRLCTVTLNKNGVPKFSNTFGYGISLLFTLSSYVDSNEVAKLVVTNDNSSEIIPWPDDNVLKLVAQANNTTIDIITSTMPTVIVRDYFGTIIYSGNATEDQIVMNNSNATVTINGTTIEAKPSPAVTFRSWELTHEADGTICIIQKGVRKTDTDKTRITATNGIITKYNTTEPITEFDGYGIPYTVTPNSGVTPIVWKMTVNGKDYLAAYESSFTRFAYNQSIEYEPITSENELGELASAYGKPVSYGEGFISGDKSDKFTLACSYSAAPGTTITEAGVLYSTNGELTSATMTKGAEGVSTKIQTRVTDFGTYTMTKTDASSGTHLMRSYVSYTEVVEGKTVIRVSYGPVYQCVDGTVSIVNS